ncbi:hypothetical protein NDN08_002587 [Rhodosorus marinus]|uniref:Peptide deformylase n=1 Tax=Rhodosorus marinus TaxID=101924 RepID=A0AAV8UWU3_9RHOD|nr:hypothetical protein NDN08_002587 [Rhodosorus marinus]
MEDKMVGFVGSGLGLSRVGSTKLDSSQCRSRVPRKLGRNGSWVRMSAETVLEEEVDPGVVEGTGLSIVKYPHPVLRRDNEEVTLFDDELAKLARNMFKVMYASKGVGLAAPQVAKNIRLMVFNAEGSEKAWLQETVLVNPKIVSTSEKMSTEPEACLSFPGMGGPVKRHHWIKVEAKTLKGKNFKMKFTDWKARIFQHEYDHLEGTVYIDHLAKEHRAEVQPVLDGLIKAFDGDEPML